MKENVKYWHMRKDYEEDCICSKTHHSTPPGESSMMLAGQGDRLLVH